MEIYMKNAVLYLGKYSPVFMGALDTCSKLNHESFVFIEMATDKSSIDNRLIDKHFVTKEPEVIRKYILSLLEDFDKLYCMTLFYSDALLLNEIKKDQPNLIVMGPSTSCIDILQDKGDMNYYAGCAGLPLLSTIDINSKDVSKYLPLVLRPKSEVRAEFKAELITSMEALRPYLTQNVVAQPYIEGPNVVVHVAKSDEFFECKFFTVDYKFEGMSLTLAHENLGVYRKLELQICDFLTRIDFSGVGHLEFILDDNSNECYFLEFNGRLGGTSLKAAALGYNEFYQLLYLYKIIDTPHNAECKKNMVVNYFALLKCIIKVATGSINILDYPTKSKFKKILCLLSLLFKARNELFFPSRLIQKSYIINLVRKVFKK
jgi:hypothetical protein